MKTIQMTIDAELLQRIDADPEAARLGRSAFLRHAATAYLQRRRDEEVAAAYRRAYEQMPPAADEFGPFGGLAWPDE